MGDRSYSFDANLLLADGVAAQTASGYAQNAGADGILDLGGNQGVTPLQQARMDGVVVIQVSAIDITSNDERYTFRLLGCNLSSFASGVAELGALSIGKGSAGSPTTQVDGAVAMYELFFTTEQANTKYEWVKLYVTMAGTTPSLTFLAYIVVLPEP